MRRGASVPRDGMEWALRAALRGIDVPHFVVAHAVEGLEPGLYRWPDLDRPLRAGDLRRELFGVCYDQGLGSDASYVVLAAADLAALDDRGYRDAQLAAGLVEGRLHLAAYAQGIGASGMTFLDTALEDFLGDGLAGLLITCVGVPEYANRAGGPPGRPQTVRVPMPRLDVPPPEPD
jgi:hypothetical protein